jgi:hypothetical protein
MMKKSSDWTTFRTRNLQCKKTEEQLKYAMAWYMGLPMKKTRKCSRRMRMRMRKMIEVHCSNGRIA